MGASSHLCLHVCINTMHIHVVAMKTAQALAHSTACLSAWTAKHTGGLPGLIFFRVASAPIPLTAP